MRKNVFGRKFKRDKNERKALFKSLISSLILNERIKTTEAKAKAIRGDAEKAVTKAKKNKEFAKRALAGLVNKEALVKLVDNLAPRFVDRNGGYTRIIRLGKRFGDDAMEVILEWTEEPKALVSKEALRSSRQLKSSSNASTPVASSKTRLGARSTKASSGKKLSRVKTSRAKTVVKK